MGTLWKTPTKTNVTRPAAGMLPSLQRFQVGDDVGLFGFRKQVRICRHAIAAGVDHGLHGFVGDLLAVLQLVVLEKALQRRTDFLFIVVGVVTHSALLEDVLALYGIAFFLVVGGHQSRQ